MVQEHKREKEVTPAIERMGHGISRSVERWFPDPFLFAIILIFIVFVMAWIIQQRNPYLLMQDMYKGFWDFLAFAMQMCLILVTGYALAYHPRVRRSIDWLCTVPKNGKQAAALIAFTSCIFSWINWGLGLIIGAYFARAMGRQSYFRKLPVHYPMLCVAGYTGLGLIWHWGLSATVPLVSTTEGHFLEKIIGIITADQTILGSYALLNSLIILFFAVVVCYLLHPHPQRCRGIEHYAPGLVEKGEEEKVEKPVVVTTADKIENNRWIALVMLLLMTGSIAYWFGTKGFMAGLDLNAVNFCFILLGLIIYFNPIAYMRAIYTAVATVGGIILQFPFYAGIQGVMMYSGLGVTLAEWLAKAATPFTYPVIAWLIGGVVNLFIPSGGGEWMTIGESISRAGVALGVPAGKFIIAYAAGDAWTNLFNPFWAIALLAITQVKARDIFGYCIAILILAVIPYALGLTFIPF
ncbi:short-chain fatty acid transporter [Chloroflexota bacterium]